MDASSLPAGCRCMGCGYALRGLADPRCPECGREFDPDDWTTVREPGPAGTGRVAAEKTWGVLGSTPAIAVLIALLGWATAVCSPTLVLLAIVLVWAAA